MIPTVCILVPAHNESRIIASTLTSATALLPPEHVYLVDDGSTDNTAQIAAQMIPNVLRIANSGKATALNKAIIEFKLPEKYDFILFLDADTQPDSDFLKYALPHFEADPKNDVVCVVGRVKGLGDNWISKYRQWEYLISHQVHKRAQANLNSIVVVPGCATIYRSHIFNELLFPTGTLTEDMDFTFLLHRQNLHKIIFEDRSIVRVQDPQRLPDLIKQITRWYTGFWQVVRKHQVPWRGQILDLEVTMLGLEGLYNGLVVILLMLSFIPLTVTGHLSVLRLPALIDLFVFFLPSLIWASISEKTVKFLLYIPHFYFLRSLSSLIFMKSFYLGFTSHQKDYVWDSQRY